MLLLTAILMMMMIGTVIPYGDNIMNDRKTIPDSIYFLSDDAINYVNNLETTWKAGRNFPSNTPRMYFVNLMGLLPVSANNLEVIPKHLSSEKFSELPENFDSREKWPNCRTMKMIRDQSNCGSCWAFATAEAFSDRICVFGSSLVGNGSAAGNVSSTGNSSITKYPYGTDFVVISADDIITCCTACGNGCFGGFPIYAWNYIQTTGVVTGGGYGNTQFCRPYPIPPCGSMTGPNCTQNFVMTPPCIENCIPEYPIPYQEDKHFVSETYLVICDEQNIMKEIFNNGPVVAEMIVFEDFLNYKSGVYQAHSTKVLGGHAVKMMGWGIENGTKYWLCANSWTDQWGDKGYFKILRGADECGIESAISSGTPSP